MAYRLVRRFRRPDPEEATFDREEQDFDRDMGISTYPIVRLVGLTVNSDNVLLGSTYVASPVSLLRPVLDGLSLHHPDFTFIDLGSGMGRVVLYAARFPYKQVIGVEFAEELHAAADQNMRDAVDAPARLGPIRLYCMDAVDFEPPNGNLVCFFFNPFASPVMEKVVSRLTRSLRNDPRDCIVIYLHPLERAVFDTNGHWEVQEEGQSYVIYKFGNTKPAHGL
jgi:SAM-dependent methyltransferase